VVVSLTLFLPICLEQFARDNGKLLPDRVHPCAPPSGTATTTSGSDETRCAVKLGWAWIDSASFRCARLPCTSVRC
jgi:UMF1 family MFS transporter